MQLQSHAFSFCSLLFVTIALAPEAAASAPDLSGKQCAERLILVAAKKNVAEQFGNHPNGSGLCAFGVRTSLQLSRVGDVTEGLGNAIDYLASMPPRGFIDSGLKDPKTAPPGSVLVFSGPKSQSYLEDGKFGSPPGTWLGHVTIKGDDGRYYTDGRTREPALGWVNSRNVQKIRNIAGIFVPGPDLSEKYTGQCARFDYSPAISGDRADEAGERRGREMIREALGRLAGLENPALAGAERTGLFVESLGDGREAAAYDDEAQLARALAGGISRDPALRSAYEAFVSTSPRETAEERCSSGRWEAALSQAICLEAAGIKGQDVSGTEAIRSCIRSFSYERCLKGR